MGKNGNEGLCKIGVYVCNCGANFGPAADVHSIEEFAFTLPGVVLVREQKYICAEGGQQMIRQDIPVFLLDRLLIVACSPQTYQAAVLDAAARAGLNPFYVAMVNIWGLGTETVMHLIKATAARLARMEDLLLRNKPVMPVAVVVAGDEAGIESARNIADDGYKVYLVLRQPSATGPEIQPAGACPLPFNPDCTECWIGPENVMDACRHPNITLLTWSESGSRVVFMENM
jgi:heterodisulfide reductase subunit A2